MTDREILRVMDTYRGYFQRNKIARKKFSSSVPVHARNELLEHCHAMLDEMEDFVVKGNLEKASRWLGFIQGVLCSLGVYTLDELKNHNRPPEATAP